MDSLVLTSILFLAYIWIAYPVILFVVVKVANKNKTSQQAIYSNMELPVLTVLIAAHNEGDSIEARIKNILENGYPADKLEVLVVSDGSSDKTVAVVESLGLKFPNVKIINIASQQGRANAHNVGVKKSKGEVLVFTDAETVFSSGFLEKIARVLLGSKTGFASGMLCYSNTGDSAVTQSVGLYWRFEMMLRSLESRLDIYLFGTGACCAVLRKLYCDIPSSGDVDFTTPLDVVLQGYKCVHIEDAVAYDVMPDTARREFRARVRMTAKNLHGSILRWGFRGIIFHPVYTLVLFSHKIGRWLTPFAMIGLFTGSIVTVGSGWIISMLLFVQTVFYILAVCGYMGWRIPFADQAYSFVLANVAFALGVMKALVGNVPSSYRPVRKS